MAALEVPTRITGPWIARTIADEPTGERTQEVLAALKERNWHSEDAVAIVVAAFSAHMRKRLATGEKATAKKEKAAS